MLQWERVWKTRWIAWVKHTHGSFTMEATFVFPLVFLCTLALIFYGVFIFQHALLQYKASTTAERTAYVWDNSHKDPITGAFILGQTDGLYWRTLQDNVSDMFRWIRGGESSHLPLPVGGQTLSNLVNRKLASNSRQLSASTTGTIRYDNKWFERTVQIDISEHYATPQWMHSMIKRSGIGASSHSLIVEPVEWIRTSELVRTLAGDIKERLTTEKWNESFSKTGDAKQDADRFVVSSEKEAVRYLKTIVSGKSVNFSTEVVGKWRTIDILDADGVAHEVKYTLNSKDAREQMAKDVELMEQGRVKGVIWHFFTHAKTGKTALTASLRKQLESKGIIIIVHPTVYLPE